MSTVLPHSDSSPIVHSALTAQSQHQVPSSKQMLLLLQECHEQASKRITL